MRSVAIKLGVFSLFTTVVTIVLAAVIGNFRPFVGRYELAAQFEDATGVLKGDIVTLAGVQVGKVKRARVEKGIAQVTLLIDNDVKLPKESSVAIRYRNLIGQRMVVLEPGEGKPPYYAEGETVPATQTTGPLDLGSVFNNLRPLLSSLRAEDINTISKALVVSFANHKGEIDGILSDTALITSELAARDEKLASLISNAAKVAGSIAGEKEELADLVSNFAAITKTLADRSGSIDSTITNLDRASGDIGRLVAENRQDLDRDLDDLATLLSLVIAHTADLDKITADLDDVFRATAKATTYGEWANLYVFSLCDKGAPGCEAPEPGLSSLFAGAGPRP